MRQETFDAFGKIDIKTAKKFNAFEKLALQHANPAKLAFHGLAGMWALYFLWHHQWGTALIVAVVFGSAGTLLALGSETEELVQSALGKFFYVTLHPANMFFEILGFCGIFYGTWAHDAMTVLLGVSSMFIANMFGWERIKKLDSYL